MPTTTDGTELVAALRQQLSVNDPFLGKASPAEFEAGSILWPGDRWSSIERVFVTEANGRRLEEYRYTPAAGDRGVLPVAFMFDLTGEKQVIVYSDHHLVDDRVPILPKVTDNHPWRSEDDVLFTYFSALNRNRLEEVLDQFETDGYFRHSNDETCRGRDELRIDFTKMMGSTGIRIDYCRFTDDGTTCAAEAYMPSGRPAVAVYERGRHGKLKAIRIYL
ncbi:hypothetical protein G6L94_31945 [Agrobacterium rhizogenes]|nr:hypothetical protein [Rhizobium rhizogenes]OCJ22098.1 hypothetical protein A6U88_30745 [Agrobacterium sp. B131/95]OCJ24384.1 hypothetical protein A6U89_30595 [Agrobacterium sp. B133/95]NTI46251.1 hypothetical protein [Rhizobium rhizogenes]NTI52934.1 hypothetical protein [Rhizobium rhizogenes]NTI98307.1 hypothetical protein [Rhizobium rhizogenes]